MGRDGRMGNDEPWMRLALAAMWTVAAAARIANARLSWLERKETNKKYKKLSFRGCKNA